MLALLLALLAPAPPMLPSLPDVSGTCQFGAITQEAERVQIKGDHWIATGTVNRAGLVKLVWIANGGRQAYGVYKLDGGNLVGHYGYADEAELIEDDICGEIHGETLFRGK